MCSLHLSSVGLLYLFLLKAKDSLNLKTFEGTNVSLSYFLCMPVLLPSMY